MAGIRRRYIIRNGLLILAGLLLVLLFSSALADGELRGYDAEQGYVYVTFGRYPQQIDGGIPDDGQQAWKWRTAYQSFRKDKANKGKIYDPGELNPDPILWRVLSADDEKIFLCSEYILFASPLDTDRKAYRENGKDFGQTELCRKLNGEFAETAFTEAERAMLIPRETFGKFFLLSVEEMDDKSLGFGTKKARKTWATEYAIRVTGAFVYQISMGNHSPCWTRTQSSTKPNAGRCTKQEGTIGYYDCTNQEEGVRPAVWMKPDSFRITGGSGTREDPYTVVPAEKEQPEAEQQEAEQQETEQPRAVHYQEEKPEDWETRDLLRVTALSFIQNDAFVLECGGQVMLVDGGSSLRGKDLVQYIQEHGINHVDRIFSTHPHDDHIEALYYAIRNDALTADEFVSPFPADYKMKEDYQQKMVALLAEKGIPFRQMLPGEEMTLGGAHMVMYRAKSGDANAMSGVLRVSFGEASMLLAADISGQAQKDILEQVGAEGVKADILKCPHHGIKRMVPAFLEAVDPMFAVITSRQETEAKAQLDLRKIPNLWTSLGDAVLETDGRDWYITQENRWVKQ